MKVYNALLILFTLFLLVSCTHMHQGDGPPAQDIDVSRIPNAVPKIEPLSKYGNPPSYVVKNKVYYTRKSAKGFHESGIASWYGTLFDKKRTSSGEPYDMFAMTAAHKSLPLPCYVKVTNKENGKVVIVKVNDRGPFHRGRIIDLSYAAAKKLGVYPKGTAHVYIEVIDPEDMLAEATQTVGALSASFYIQAGSFTEYRNARKLQNQLRKATQYPVKINKVIQTDQRWYLVKVGPIDDSIAAKTEEAELAKQHFNDTLLVKR